MATSKKKLAVKKVAVKKVSIKKSTFNPKSFQLCESPKPFITTRITQQTVYWLILATFVTFVTLWVLKIQLDILTVLNGIN